MAVQSPGATACSSPAHSATSFRTVPDRIIDIAGDSAGPARRIRAAASLTASCLLPVNLPQSLDGTVAKYGGSRAKTAFGTVRFATGLAVSPGGSTQIDYRLRWAEQSHGKPGTIHDICSSTHSVYILIVDDEHVQMLRDKSERPV